MKPASVQRTVQSSGVLSTTKFGISEKDQAHILGILRDRLYSNKKLAVLREYSSNAWDAHRDAGIPTRPIKIVLPTSLESSLIIRDYGLGLSEDDIFDVYVKYGASTKRDSNEAVGMLGIGAKSAFAYSDSFTVTSFHGGLKKVYVAVLDESDMGTMSKLYEEPSTETGVEIKVPVSPGDISGFMQEAKYLFPFFTPQPEINYHLEDPITDRKKNGFLNKNGYSVLPNWVAVMGCVPYRLDFSRLQEELEELELGDLQKNLKGGLFFDIGDVDISASREDLEYTDRTKKAIVDKIFALAEELAKELDDLVKAAPNPWQARWAVREFSARTGAPIPKRYQLFNRASTPLYDVAKADDRPKHFILAKVVSESTKSGKRMSLSKTDRISVDQYSKIIVRDEFKKPLRGRLDWQTPWYVVTPREQTEVDKDGMVTKRWKPTTDQVEEELRERLKNNDAEGIPVHRLTEFEYVPVSSGSGGYKNSKHTKRTFALQLPASRYESTLSNHWEVHSEALEEHDIFVLLDKFKVFGEGHGFYGNVTDDYLVLTNLYKMDFPSIYGIKTTDKKPVLRKDVNAVPYWEWAWSTYQWLKVQKETKQLLKDKEWRDHYYTLSSGHRKGTVELALKEMLPHFDGRHRLVSLLRRSVKGREAHGAMSQTKRDSLDKFISQYEHWEYVAKRKQPKKKKSTPTEEYVAVPKRLTAAFEDDYPLLNPANGGPGVRVFLNKNVRGLWADYVNLIDKQKKN
jgi:hypothetical protein